MEIYIDKTMDFLLNQKNMFLEEYINIFNKDVYKGILYYYNKIYDLEKILKKTIENKSKKDNFILESLLKLLKVNNILIHPFVMREINQIYLTKNNNISNYIKTYIKENNLPFDIKDNQLTYNNLYKEYGNNKELIFSIQSLKDGRLILLYQNIL